MSFMKTIINSIKYWANRQIKDVNEKLTDLSTNVNRNFITRDEMDRRINKKMDLYDPVGSGSFSMNRKTGSVIGLYSHAEGYDTTASGDCSHTEGKQSTASGDHSHAEGYDTTASGDCSHAEGEYTTASRNNSHAEGNHSIASGQCSHAEGKQSTASNFASHAEGEYTTASGVASHTEGSSTTASGDHSHAEGLFTTAQRRSQHTQGEYNILDTKGTTSKRGEYAHIVGNGTSDANRSNAYTLDWNGVGWYQGGLQVGGNAQDDGAKNVLLKGDAIPVPTSATIGQTIVVKTVDKNSKPTEWEAVDMNVLTSPNGKKFKITIDDDGVLTATEVVESTT